MDKKSEETKHRMEWCANASKYLCMRCGRGSKYMKMQGKCKRVEILGKMFGENGESNKWEDTTW